MLVCLQFLPSRSRWLSRPWRHPPPPPPTMLRGRSFADVYQSVMQRSGEMLPDQVVHVADLRMTPEGNITLPGALCYRINDHAKRQISSLLGLRWEKWFGSASGEERAEEVNRRFQRTPGEKKIRNRCTSPRSSAALSPDARWAAWRLSLQGRPRVPLPRPCSGGVSGLAHGERVA